MTLSGTKDTTCFVCGPDNPLGLQVPFEPDGEAGSNAIYVARKEHGGWNGILCGEVVFALMDEALGWSLYFQRIPPVTRPIETSFHQPIPIGTHLPIRAWVTGQRRRFFDATAEVRVDNVRDGSLQNRTLCSIPFPRQNSQTAERNGGTVNNTALELKIREFEPGDETAFRLLNEEWITREFVLEPKDVYSLSDPQTTILDQGGRILSSLFKAAIPLAAALWSRSNPESSK